jgi:anti-anti-sigma factor
MALDTTIAEVEGRVPITVLALDGELDASNFESLIERVNELYLAGTRHLLIDLTDLRFLASSGLVALYSAVQLMHGEPPPDLESGWGAFHSMDLDAAGGTNQSEVQLCGAQPAVARVLDRTGLAQLFPMHTDRATAVAAF